MPIRRSFLLAAFVAWFCVGCEASFDPFEESDVTFSLFGYLDVAADTQYVRVNELQRTVGSDAPVAATVTLEDLERGTTVTLQDTLLRFGNGVSAYAFWTAQPVAPSTPYRILADSPDGNDASVTLRTPALIPNPMLETGLSPFSSAEFPPTSQSMTITDAVKLVDLRITYRLTEPTRTLTLSYLDRVQLTPDGTFSLAFSSYNDVQRALGGGDGTACPGLSSARVFLGVSTEEWPDFPLFTTEELAIPTTVTNVEGGFGYVGGVLIMEYEWTALSGAFFFNQQSCLG
ncbi:MAG: hypothetical protein AAF624_09935 [Bacteroidota bacterium]